MYDGAYYFLQLLTGTRDRDDPIRMRTRSYARSLAFTPRDSCLGTILILGRCSIHSSRQQSGLLTNGGRWCRSIFLFNYVEEGEHLSWIHFHTKVKQPLRSHRCIKSITTGPAHNEILIVILDGKSMNLLCKCHAVSLCCQNVWWL